MSATFNIPYDDFYMSKLEEAFLSVCRTQNPNALIQPVFGRTFGDGWEMTSTTACEDRSVRRWLNDRRLISLANVFSDNYMSLLSIAEDRQDTVQVTIDCNEISTALCELLYSCISIAMEECGIDRYDWNPKGNVLNNPFYKEAREVGEKIYHNRTGKEKALNTYLTMRELPDKVAKEIFPTYMNRLVKKDKIDKMENTHLNMSEMLSIISCKEYRTPIFNGNRLFLGIGAKGWTSINSAYETLDRLWKSPIGKKASKEFISDLKWDADSVESAAGKHGLKAMIHAAFKGVPIEDILA